MGHFPGEQEPVSIVLFHGLISSSSEFTPLMNAGLGFPADIYSPEFTGYSARSLNGSTKWEVWIESAIASVRDVVQKTNRPVYVGGLCIGALLALEVARRHPEWVTGVLLMSPTLFYDGWGLPWWYGLRHIGYYLPVIRRWWQVAERDPFGVKNPQIRKWIAREMQKEKISGAGAISIPLWAIHEAEKLIRFVKPKLNEVQQPTLILHAREDEVTSMRSPLYLMRHLGAVKKELQVLENSYHMITLDNDRQLVKGRIANFIQHLETGFHGHIVKYHQTADRRKVRYSASVLAG